MTVVKQRELQKLMIQGVEQARLSSETVLVSRSVRIAQVDPLSFFACGKRDRFFWMDPEGNATIVGSGTANRLSATGRTRFQLINKKRDALLRNSLIEADPAVSSTGPLWLGGFSFDPEKKREEVWQSFSEADLNLPSFMLTVSGGEAWLTINCIVEPTTDPLMKTEQILKERDRLLKDCESFPSRSHFESNKLTLREIAPQQFKDAVRDASNEIRNGVLDKIVLSRVMKVQSEANLSVVQLLQRLREEQPNSFLFAIERKESCLVGASPERLVKREGERVFSACIAGTTARGKTLSEDEQLGNELLHDRKNLHEHQLVVDMIQSAMKQICSKVEIPDHPSLYKMKNVQHLYTPVVGQAKGKADILSVVEQLHPTPALGGFPQQLAVEKIRAIETHDRGWYGAPVGWLDYKGNGEFAVAIRSGVIHKNEATLFAGNGIVGDSEPESEYRETQMKFRPMLSALGGDGL
ncbi:MAG TPA: isochorismate synthase [Bacillales bacterium]|nr:isochorismate synthase [Bacillales bacterium]